MEGENAKNNRGTNRQNLQTSQEQNEVSRTKIISRVHETISRKGQQRRKRSQDREIMYIKHRSNKIGEKTYTQMQDKDTNRQAWGCVRESRLEKVLID